MTISERTHHLGLALGVVVAASASFGCNGKKPEAPKKSPAPMLSGNKGPVVLACKLDLNDLGPMRRAGRARVKIEGPGIALDAKDVPCACGPMLNVDNPTLGIKAGTGLFFETCLPHGSVQVSSFERNLGDQAVHSETEHGGAEVSFNRVADSSFTSRGLPTDKISFSDDFNRATASVELHDVGGDRKFKAEIEFDCRP